MIVYNGVHSAVYSDDRKYRYCLTRRLTDGKTAPKKFVVVGLYPSPVDEAGDDPMTRSYAAFAKRSDCTELVMVNFFAFVQSDRKRFAQFASREYDRAVGPKNDAMLRSVLAFDRLSLLVVAWGALDSNAARIRELEVRTFIRLSKLNPLCFGENKDGSPKRPVFLPNATTLQPYFGGQDDL